MQNIPFLGKGTKSGINKTLILLDIWFSKEKTQFLALSPTFLHRWRSCRISITNHYEWNNCLGFILINNFDESPSCHRTQNDDQNQLLMKRPVGTLLSANTHFAPKFANIIIYSIMFMSLTVNLTAMPPSHKCEYYFSIQTSVGIEARKILWTYLMDGPWAHHLVHECKIILKDSNKSYLFSERSQSKSIDLWLSFLSSMPIEWFSLCSLNLNASRSCTRSSTSSNTDLKYKFMVNGGETL